MNIHLIGIGGIGLSAIARFLKYDGHNITGSDIKSTKITKSLQEEGIEVSVPHNQSFLIDKNIDLVIYSAVVKQDNEELIYAKKHNIQTYSRKDALKFLLKEKKVYSVCGAHGKSTTTAILSSILQSSSLIGAISKEFGSNFKYKDDLVVFEADESDGSFLNSNPYCAIVTNAEPEHMEYYNYDYDKFYGAYEEFLNKANLQVVNYEDEFLTTLEYANGKKVVPSKDIRNLEYFIKNGEPYTKFDFKDYGTFEVWGFGEHIAINTALAIKASLNEIDDIEVIRQNLLRYKGIKKRFDIVQKNDNFILIDDYAHHPTEIEATIQSAKLYSSLYDIDNIVMIWQPHKYSRTKDNLEHFKRCFDGVNQLIILPVWTAGEDAIDIDFQKEFNHYNPIFTDKIETKDGYITFEQNGKKIIIDTGLIVGVGAGDITYQLEVVR